MGVGRRRKGDMPERKHYNCQYITNICIQENKKISIFRGKIKKLDETLHAECRFQMKKISKSELTHFEFSRTL